MCNPFVALEQAAVDWHKRRLAVKPLEKKDDAVDEKQMDLGRIAAVDEKDIANYCLSSRRILFLERIQKSYPFLLELSLCLSLSLLKRFRK